jgi:DNA-directed RNA polymerase specialized sigma24 family protein
MIPRPATPAQARTGATASGRLFRSGELFGFLRLLLPSAADARAAQGRILADPDISPQRASAAALLEAARSLGAWLEPARARDLVDRRLSARADRAPRAAAATRGELGFDRGAGIQALRSELKLEPRSPGSPVEDSPSGNQTLLLVLRSLPHRPRAALSLVTVYGFSAQDSSLFLDCDADEVRRLHDEAVRELARRLGPRSVAPAVHPRATLRPLPTGAAAVYGTRVHLEHEHSGLVQAFIAFLEHFFSRLRRHGFLAYPGDDTAGTPSRSAPLDPTPTTQPIPKPKPTPSMAKQQKAKLTRGTEKHHSPLPTPSTERLSNPRHPTGSTPGYRGGWSRSG